MSTAVTNPFPGVYQAAYLEELGVTVEEFARDPEAALIRVGQYDACALIQAGLRPLMPVQVRLRQALEKQWEAGGTPVVRLPPPLPILREQHGAKGNSLFDLKKLPARFPSFGWTRHGGLAARRA